MAYFIPCFIQFITVNWKTVECTYSYWKNGHISLTWGWNLSLLWEELFFFSLLMALCWSSEVFIIKRRRRKLSHFLRYFQPSPIWPPVSTPPTEASHQHWKGVWHKIFDLRFFSWISFPQASEYSTGAVSNFYEKKNSRSYMLIADVVDTGNKLLTLVWTPQVINWPVCYIKIRLKCLIAECAKP